MVNYNKSIVYRLVCKDPTIPDEYIGSTTNKNRRKQQHKDNCNNENRKKHHNFPVYQFIRANGGFDNWTMIILEEYSCECKVELEMRERYWIELRKPTLNKQIPTRTDKEYREENREHIKEQQKQYREDHKDEINEKQRMKYLCECGAEVSKGNLPKHRKTQKHLKYLEQLN